MILEVDAGNSSIKWRIVSQERDAVLARGFFSTLDISAQVFPAGIKRALVSCVAKNNDCQSLEELLTKCSEEPPLFVKASAAAGRITNGYIVPEQLGVDRWLAILAASDMTDTPFLVIDAGSALTVDIVDNQGAHQGGYITPGLSMMRRSLLSETEGVRFKIFNDFKSEAGCSTDQAVNRGILSMAVSFLEQIIKATKLRLGADTQVYLTGGDANVLAEMLGSDVFCEPDMVLNGLVLAAQQ